jgi:hypothetical protein
MVQHAAKDGAVFPMLFMPSSDGTKGLCIPLLDNGSVNTFLCIRPCYESSDINSRDGVFHGISAECL